MAILGAEPGVFDKLTVIIEGKGRWNPDLNRAMLTSGDCHHGIYAVGWFAC